MRHHISTKLEGLEREKKQAASLHTALRPPPKITPQLAHRGQDQLFDYLEERTTELSLIPTLDITC